MAFSWRELDSIVVNSAGCAAAMKEWPHLMEESGKTTEEIVGFASKVQDICQFLVELDPNWELSPLPIRVAYDDPCHLLHGQGIFSQPRQLLEKIPELTLLEVPNGDRCCGSAGIYNILQPEMSQTLLEKKIQEILSTNPQRVATANPGCLMQIQYGLKTEGGAMPVQHPVELLSESIGTNVVKTVL